MYTQSVYNNQQKVESVIPAIAKSVPALEDRLNFSGYSSGKLGLCIFYCYLAKYTDDAKYLEHAESILYRTINTIDPSAYKGFASVFYREMAEIGIVINFLNASNLLLVEAEAFLNQLDEVLYANMQKKIVEGDLSMVAGALSAGYYFLTRSKALPEAKIYLNELINGIEEKALQDNYGNYYWKWPYFKSNGVYLSLSWGSAMMLTFLTALYENNIAQNKITEIIRKASNYIWSQKRDFKDSYFPIVVGERVGVQSLLSGDLGTCYGLLKAAKILKSQELEQATMRILFDCCTRKTPENTLIYDASICYGASGVASLFDKIYRITNYSVFQETAAYWHNYILTFCHHQNEFAGFKAWFNQKYPYTNLAFNEGIIGIGLVLMRSQDPGLPSLDPLVGLW